MTTAKKLDRSKEVPHSDPKVKELSLIAMLYLREGRGALFQNERTVTNNGPFRLEFESKTDLAKTMRSAGFCQTSKDVWEVRIAK